MGECSHHHEHHHHGHHHARLSADGRLTWAAAINGLLTIAQLIGGIASGSLALIAEAIHNFSDAAAFVMALAAQKIGRRKPDAQYTYGYHKIETLSAFTNLLILICISLWLVVEAIIRFFNPSPIMAETIIGVSLLALLVNGATVVLTRRDAKHSRNVRAAYLHNLGDTLSTIGVIIGGFFILEFGWVWLDPLLTLFISAYIIWHTLQDFPDVVRILIDGKPVGVDMDAVSKAMTDIDGVENVHHLHIRYLNEHEYALEGHIVTEDAMHEDSIRANIKTLLTKFKITHSTLEFERVNCGNADCSATKTII